MLRILYLTSCSRCRARGRAADVQAAPRAADKPRPCLAQWPVESRRRMPGERAQGPDYCRRARQHHTAGQPAQATVSSRQCTDAVSFNYDRIAASRRESMRNCLGQESGKKCGSRLLVRIES